jgi:FkbM family methyltransferase
VAILGLRRTHLNNTVCKAVLRWFARAGVLPFRWVCGITQHERFRVRIDGSSFLYQFSGSDNIGELLYWLGLSQLEPAVMAKFAPLCRDARIILDVGANTGLYSLAALSLNPRCQVVAWEPFRGNYERLQANIEANGFADRCTLRLEAAASQSGTLRLSTHENWAMHSAVFERGGPVTQVAATSIDEVVPSRAPVDLVKIDVEGFEYDVLKGALRVLQEARPVLLIELHPEAPNAAKTRELLSDLGYTLKALDAHANWIALPPKTSPNHLASPGLGPL